jgi:EmrB/QacA subfamily drug resistance transporter
MQYKWTALSVTMVGTIMAGLDTRIVIIGLPTIAKQLHAGAVEAVWITQAYIITSTILVLLFGRMTDLFGRVRLYTTGFAVFTIGSFLCSLSPDPAMLIGCRIVQGIGAGMLSSSSIAIITDASPKNELGTMLGINTSAFRMGNVAGLTLSGLILSVVNWSGLFWVNVPIGIFGTIWARKRLREISTPEKSKKMDWPGIILFAAGLTIVLIGISMLSYGGSGTYEGCGLLAIGFLALASFSKLESRLESPLLDLRLFKIKQFALGNIAQLLNGLAFYGTLLLIAFYLQIGLGYTPLQAGLGILPLDGVYLFSSLIGGKLSDRYGARLIATIGLLTGTASFFAMYTLGPHSTYISVAIFLLIVGIGNGLFNPPNVAAIMGSVPSNRVGVAAGFRNTIFNISQASSYGLLILFMTIGISYGQFNALVQGTVTQASLALAKEQFFNAMRIAVLILATLNAAAILPSVLRGKKRAKTNDTSKKTTPNEINQKTQKGPLGETEASSKVDINH